MASASLALSSNRQAFFNEAADSLRTPLDTFCGLFDRHSQGSGLPPRVGQSE